jgi:predicted phosphoadenosine phosphosulfate sulfurtransferase
MSKQYLEIDVLQATKERICYLFDHFPKLYVSFSGGKDSGVLLHLVMEEAIARNRKVGVLLVDLEAQYTHTIQYCERMATLYKNHIDLYWVALPLHMRNAVSQLEPQWVCWDKHKTDLWVRQPSALSITDETFFPFYRYAMEFEEFIEDFSTWYAKGELCACLVGIRTDESLNRYRSIASTSKKTFKGKCWTTQYTPHTIKAYPVYDWATKDIWIYNGKFNKDYNKVYDVMHQAGLTIHQARLCQPYGDDQRKGLWLFHILEPTTWCKIMGRVSGANYGALYAQDSGSVLGNRTISKPAHLTWKDYTLLCLNSMPCNVSEHYKNKIATYLKWHKTRGYPDDIPDDGEISTKKVPSWKRICRMLMKHDYWAKGLSFSPTTTAAYTKYLQRMKQRREEWGILND